MSSSQTRKELNMGDTFGSESDSVSDELKELFEMFPPFCRVIAQRRLRVPGLGRVGRVVGYIEGNGGDFKLIVQDEAIFLPHERTLEGDDSEPWQCSPEWLIAVQYDGDKTPGWVRRTLARTNLLSAHSPILEGRIEGPMAAGPVQLCLIRWDNAGAIVVHPDAVELDGGRLFVREENRKIPVTYVPSLSDAEA
jgi:hypothetical protein